WLQSAFAVKVRSARNSIVYFDWSASRTTPWKAGVFSLIPVSFHVLPSSSAGGRPPGAKDDAALEWALDGRACTGPNVIVPPSVSVIVSVSFVTEYVAASVSEWAKIVPKSLSPATCGQKASVDGPAVIISELPLVL